MVREAIKRGEQAIVEEAKANGAVHQNAKQMKRCSEVIQLRGIFSFITYFVQRFIE